MPKKMSLEDLIFTDAQDDDEQAVIVEESKPKPRKGRKPVVKKVSKKVVIDEPEESEEEEDEGVEYEEPPSPKEKKTSRVKGTTHTDELRAILEQNQKMLERMNEMEQKFNSSTNVPIPSKPRRGFAW